MKRFKAGSPPRLSRIAAALAVAGIAAVPVAALADGVNPNCTEESVFYNPGNGEDIVVPRGFKVEVFAKGLNFPTDVAFVGSKDNFKVYVLESGTGLPGKCNNNDTDALKAMGIGKFSGESIHTRHPGLRQQGQQDGRSDRQTDRWRRRVPGGWPGDRSLLRAQLRRR